MRSTARRKQNCVSILILPQIKVWICKCNWCVDVSSSSVYVWLENQGILDVLGKNNLQNTVKLLSNRFISNGEIIKKVWDMCETNLTLSMPFFIIIIIRLIL